jgi:hypothetical protein
VAFDSRLILLESFFGQHHRMVLFALDLGGQGRDASFRPIDDDFRAGRFRGNVEFFVATQVNDRGAAGHDAAQSKEESGQDCSNGHYAHGTSSGCVDGRQIVCFGR